MPRAYQAPENLNQDLNQELNEGSDDVDGFNDEFNSGGSGAARDIRSGTNFSKSRRPARPQSFDPRADEIGKSAAKKGAKKKVVSDEDKKEVRKKLLTLLSNQTACLVIIFALIGAYNWMSADYSGEFISQDKELGLVKLSLIRRATTIDGELYYNDTPALEMQQGKQPKEGQVDLTFTNQNPWAVRPGSIVRSRFIGTIDSSVAEGAIVDFHGSHEVRLTKNIVASLFRQLQAHIPTWRAPTPPPLFRVPKETVGSSSGSNGSSSQNGQAFSGESNTGAVNLDRRPLNGSETREKQNSPAPIPEQPKPFSFTSPFKQFQSH